MTERAEAGGREANLEPGQHLQRWEEGLDEGKDKGIGKEIRSGHGEAECQMSRGNCRMIEGPMSE